MHDHESQFPILKPVGCYDPLPFPPWSWVSRFSVRIKANHDQSLDELARRGGLCPTELWLAVHDLDGTHVDDITEEAAIRWLQGQPWIPKSPVLH